ncbi:hypothetical protein P691DRAFT_734816 [Macrolepiota fuliginosa MF-IS2]|uniref:ELYS-like domain-containing protein n=1 Tax=Macrolepiota fuliginosa MF-IS2 TaxID=1400762 RepID=A0A9P5X8Z6_9AGAR|nr:hypothetical protein P691DRAFT_734816 [Macrolepiota fuliginosa MF-IS2]
MENGTDNGRNFSYLTYFDISNNFAWRASRPQEIEQRRAMLDDSLIYDILLRSGGIRSPDILYPPRDEHSLIRLLEAIENSHYDMLKKDCLVYFLLKWHQDGREERFATQKCIPPQFSALADAYWHLDSGINLTRGVSILADARLNRDYASKILQAISLSADAPALIRKYVRTAKPPLTEPDDIELFTIALADSSLLEAWQFQRTFHESNEIRPRLLHKILEWCILPKPRPAALMQLLSLPLSAFEESTLHLYVSRPPATLPSDALPLFQDLICVRLIQLGRYVDAIRMDRQFTSSKVGTNTRQTQERSKMVQDLYDALPAIERAFIDAELAEKVTPNRPEKPSQKAPVGEDVDMTQSWEEIRPSDLHTSTSKLPPTRPIPERAHAPRFGGPIPALPTLPTVPQLSNMLGVSATTHRQSFPPPTLPVAFSSPSGSRPRHSLSNTAGRLALGAMPHVSSPLSGVNFPIQGSSQPAKPAGNPFISANQQPNAFYTPPPKANGHAKPLFPLPAPREAPPAKPDATTTEPEKPDGDTQMEGDEGEDQKQMEEEPGAPEPEPEPEPQPAEERELGFSIFGNDLSSWTNIENKFPGTSPEPAAAPTAQVPQSQSLSASISMKRKVPGSFGDDDEDEDMDEAVDPYGDRTQTPAATKDGQEEEEDEEEVITARTTRSSRQSISARSTASRTHKKARSKRTESKDRGVRGRPSIPGTLIDDNDQEEEDHVAPLRSTKASASGRKSTAGMAGRTSRGSTAEDLADELGEGVQTRRRSSRLTASGAGPGSFTGEPEASPKKLSTRARKPTAKAATGGTRKKRT